MRLRTAVLLPLTLTLNACSSITDLDLDLGCLLCGEFGPWIDAPYEPQILRGDTLRVRAWGSSDNAGTWRLSNDVAAFAGADGLRAQTGPTDNVLIRGLRLGKSDLSFMPVGSSTSLTAMITVRDSAEVADIDFLSSEPADTLRLRVGEPVQLMISLVDSSRRVIHAWPETVTISDTLVLRRQPYSIPPRPGEFLYQGAMVGTTSIVATFRELRRTLIVVVQS